MKKTLIIICSLVLVFAFSANAYSSELSYGISILRREVGIKKCSVAGETLHFTPDDFEEALGVDKIGAICISTLPDIVSGRLTLDGNDVFAGQIIERKNISSLCFVPNNDDELTVSFTFSDAKESESPYLCTINLINGENSAPNCFEVSYSTQKNIELIKSLSAYDSDGDEIKFSLITSPNKGKVYFLDEKTGKFSYMPSTDFIGKDSFEYSVSDIHGNTSDVKKVLITVEKPACDVFYSDMCGNPAHNDAIKLAAKGIMTGETIGGVSYFYPKETISRATFLRLCMQTVNVELSPIEVSSTVFEDDEEIMSYDKPYIACALQSGIIKGVETDDGTVFHPNDDISYGEAVTILDRLIGQKAVVSNVFSDIDSIGHWAASAYCNLLACGIVDSEIPDFDSPLTRDIAAQMLVECSKIE